VPEQLTALLLIFWKVQLGSLVEAAAAPSLMNVGEVVALTAPDGDAGVNSMPLMTFVPGARTAHTTVLVRGLVLTIKAEQLGSPDVVSPVPSDNSDAVPVIVPKLVLLGAVSENLMPSRLATELEMAQITSPV
jgi:hypothetical protein